MNLVESKKRASGSGKMKEGSKDEEGEEEIDM